MTRVVYVVGARPNYMKVAPIHAALPNRGVDDQLLVHTGQHYDASLTTDLFAELGLPRPDIQLAIGSGSHAEQTARGLEQLERTFVDVQPDLVVVPGDVNSTLAAALAAVKLEIPVCHVEAGLRSFDPSMPEEHNRKLTDHVSSLLLTHSANANENLLREGITSGVELVGNTMIDTLLRHVEAARAAEPWRALGLTAGGYVLVTLHRPALVDDAHLLAETMAGLGEIGRVIPVVFPAHPRTRIRLGRGQAPPGVTVLDAMPYLAFLGLEAAAGAVVTDSGGVQEETTALGVRCFTLRTNTERPVTIDHGTNELLGLEPRRLAEVPARLDLPRQPRLPPLWDGQAGERAARAIAAFV